MRMKTRRDVAVRSRRRAAIQVELREEYGLFNKIATVVSVDDPVSKRASITLAARYRTIVAKRVQKLFQVERMNTRGFSSE